MHQFRSSWGLGVAPLQGRPAVLCTLSLLGSKLRLQTIASELGAILRLHPLRRPCFSQCMLIQHFTLETQEVPGLRLLTGLQVPMSGKYCAPTSGDHLWDCTSNNFSILRTRLYM